jgi:hypothetical protein
MNMNERVIELYKQAIEFAYTSIGKEHADTTYFQGVVAGKHAELIVQECVLISRTSTDGFGAGKRMEEHFGVE